MAPEEYSSTVRWLFSKHLSLGTQLGLERMQEACRRLGNPERGLQCVHVAGTNGKGSVCTKIAKAYELSGRTTGLFTSPHISSFRERIQINGVCISEQEVIDGVDTIRSLCPDTLTFFEITTLLAFLWFRKQKVQRAVLETGLGGRLDATNVCLPELCVITSISFDHMDYLGTSLEEIATEKAGILKENIPVVIGPRVPLTVISLHAKKRSVPLYHVEGEWADFDAENSALAEKALHLLNMPSEVIEKALRFRPPCRFQEIHLEGVGSQLKSVVVVLDVAHNPDGIQRLLMKAKRTFPNSRFCILLAVSHDKDVKEMVFTLCNEAVAIVCTEAPSTRAMSSSELARVVRGANPSLCVRDVADPQEALRAAVESAAAAGTPLLVTGTFFFMGAIRAALGLVEERDLYDLNASGVPSFASSLSNFSVGPTVF